MGMLAQFRSYCKSFRVRLVIYMHGGSVKTSNLYGGSVKKVPYSGKLSKEEKTFVNFALLCLSVKVFSTIV